MVALFIERTASVNIDLLHEELTAVSGYEACSVHPDGVTVYFSRNVDLNSLRAIVQVHDESGRSTNETQLANLKSEINSLKSQVRDIDNLTAQEATLAIKLLYKVLRVNELI